MSCPLDRDPGAYETISTLTSATSLTKATYWPTTGTFAGMSPRAAVVKCETAAVNYTLDGTTPTVITGTNVGHLLDAGEEILLETIGSVRGFKAINRTASSGSVLKVTYFY